MTTNTFPFEVRLRPGCHNKPNAPVVSRHRTLEAAVRAARRSDRLQVERSNAHGCVWHAPKRRSKYGEGLYGTGPQPGEPSLAECVREAVQRLAAMAEA
jgi:hypothetical protein